jgi:hypothetical protein
LKKSPKNNLDKKCKIIYLRLLLGQVQHPLLLLAALLLAACLLVAHRLLVLLAAVLNIYWERLDFNCVVC